MPSYKKITDYSKNELDEAIEKAIQECSALGLDFYLLLKGVDAYFERRARKQKEL